jgi:hypothetical protein
LPTTGSHEPRRIAYSVRIVKDGQVETREVMVGIMNRLSAQVVSGLVEGDEVILDATPEPKSERKSSSKRPAKL